MNQEDTQVAGEFQHTNEYHYAGFWLRFVAHLIDFTLLNGAEFILESILANVFGVSPFFQQIIGVSFSLFFYYWYFCVYQVKHGTTIGKRLLGIYVLDEKSGNFLSKKQAVYRTMSYVASYLIIGCGFFMAAFHPQKKALHDLFVGTVSVVRRKPKVKVESEVQPT